MIEKHYNYTDSNTKTIAKIIDDENINLNHMVLQKNECLPEHFSNSNVYLIVIHGTLTIRLAEQEAHKYPHHSFINVPYNTKMNISNTDDEILEFFVVKSPNPKDYKKS